MGDGMKRASTAGEVTQGKPKLSMAMMRSLRVLAGRKDGGRLPYTTAFALVLRGMVERSIGTDSDYRITAAGLEALK